MTTTPSPPENSFLPFTGRLIALAAPRRENAVFELLVRRWRGHLHGRAETVLWVAVAMAAVSALLVPARFISFFIWHAVLFGHVIWPGVRFPYDLRRGKAGLDDLLVTPLRPGRYVQALRSLFWLGTLYAAIPYLVYWMTLMALKATVYPMLFAGRDNAAVLASAGLYFAVLTSVFWFIGWCAAAGGVWTGLAALAPLLLLPFISRAGPLYGTVPFPVSPGYWVAAVNLLIFGHLIAVSLGRKRENIFACR